MTARPYRIHLVSASFGERFIGAEKRFLRQANQLHIFDEIQIVTDRVIDSDLQSKLNSYPEFSAKVRGHGWWFWKSFVVQHFFNAIEDGDILLYCDVGLELNANARNALIYLIETSNQYGSLFFENNNQPEFKWTKAETLKKIGANDTAVATSQIQGTCFFLKKNTANESFLKSWTECSIMNHFELIKCEFDPNIQSTGFIAHRHDQSILSLLAKKNQLHTIPDQINFPHWQYYKSSFILKYPLHALRNPNEESILETLGSQRNFIISALKYHFLRIINFVRTRI